MTQARSQCSTCTHFRSPLDAPRGMREGGPTCAAFPGGIPDKVYGNTLDHRQPIDGDHGVRWTSDGREFPEYALTSA